ncbi:hypothetical protein RRG08_062000 [Elysia crispata]|uniref:2-phosphoxylose phosphatase 1 n=1 Tax=Elysia crispata TaxID=231223 RepID=A0AAE1A343_9GAST|nr:hypothetical protein RRG08_062000 [Elysia crispata]
MNTQVMKTGVLALFSGVTAYLYHASPSRRKLLALHDDDVQILTTEHCFPSDLEGMAKVPKAVAKEGPLVLQLQQVQIMFRHGARTPLHTAPKIAEVDYDADLLIRGHQPSMFPYVKISNEGEILKKWSPTEIRYWKQPLRGGALTGQLTAYGKEQMYNVGLRLKEDYIQRLDIATYNPSEVRTLSSNFRRTVESAQCVLAGMYGKEHLIGYAECCGPVRIYIPDPCYNILVPNTETCGVLRKSNHATVNPDSLPGFKEKRCEVEEHIMRQKEPLKEAVREVQSRIDQIVEYYENEGVRTTRREINKHRQHYQYDPLLQPLYDERGRAIDKVDRFWANVLNREPALQDIIKRGDMRALVYLRNLEVEQFVGTIATGYRIHLVVFPLPRNLEVEQFEGTIATGYRIHLYFDKNPFFHNTYLCKEVFTNGNPSALPSRETPIKWKSRSMQKLVQEALFKEEADEIGDMTHQVVCEDTSPRRGVFCRSKVEEPPVEEAEPEESGDESFFLWFTTPTSSDSDTVGSAIMGDVWKNPISVMENEPKVPDPWDQKFHFLYGNDDSVARVVHGWEYPAELRKYRDQIAAEATTILHISMTGRNPEARRVIPRLSAGPLLTELVNTARKRMCGEMTPKLCLYSTHDGELAAIMEALGIWRDQWPPFASDLRIELYREVDGSEYFVRVLYNGKEQRVRGQTESYMHWMDFCHAMKCFTITRHEMERICRSDILERFSDEVIKQSRGKEVKRIQDTPEIYCEGCKEVRNKDVQLAIDTPEIYCEGCKEVRNKDVQLAIDTPEIYCEGCKEVRNKDVQLAIDTPEIYCERCKEVRNKDVQLAIDTTEIYCEGCKEVRNKDVQLAIDTPEIYCEGCKEVRNKDVQLAIDTTEIYYIQLAIDTTEIYCEGCKEVRNKDVQLAIDTPEIYCEGCKEVRNKDVQLAIDTTEIYCERCKEVRNKDVQLAIDTPEIYCERCKEVRNKDVQLAIDTPEIYCERCKEVRNKDVQLAIDTTEIYCEGCKEVRNKDIQLAIDTTEIYCEGCKEVRNKDVQLAIDTTEIYCERCKEVRNKDVQLAIDTPEIYCEGCKEVRNKDVQLAIDTTEIYCERCKEARNKDVQLAIDTPEIYCEGCKEVRNKDVQLAIDTPEIYCEGCKEASNRES